MKIDWDAPPAKRCDQPRDGREPSLAEIDQRLRAIEAKLESLLANFRITGRAA